MSKVYRIDDDATAPYSDLGGHGIADQRAIIEATLPAGAYALTASALAQSSERNIWTCSLATPGVPTLGVGWATTGFGTVASTGATVTVDAAVTLTAPTAITLWCNRIGPDTGSGAVLFNARIVAVQGTQVVELLG